MLDPATAIKKGDISAFELIFDQFHEKLYFFILHKTNSTYLVEEVVQETFIKLWEYRGRLNEEIPLSFQVYRIATTTLIDLLRKQKSLQKLQSFYGAIDKHISDEEIQQNIDAAELNQKLMRAIQSMPPSEGRFLN